MANHAPAERTVSTPRPAAREAASPHAAVLALQRTAGNRAVARWVGQRASSVGWVYYSSYEPGTLYATEAEARAADERLAAGQGSSAMGWTPDTRFPTVYSYTHTASTSQLGDKPQGPHTFPHVEVGHAVQGLKSREEWLQVFYEQIPDPEAHQQMLTTEKRTPGAIAFELQRLSYDYRNLYEYVEAELWNSASNLDNLRALISRLLELNPYGTYGWKSKAAASHRSTKGKGERRGKAKVDTGGRWQDQKAYEKFLENRKSLSQGDYMITDEELEYDGQLDGEYMSMDELLGAIVAGDEVVGNTIELYPTGEWVIRAIHLRTQKTDDGVIVTGARIRLGRKGG